MLDLHGFKINSVIATGFEPVTVCLEGGRFHFILLAGYFILLLNELKNAFVHHYHS